MIYKQCPLCFQPWFSLSKNALVKIDPETLGQESKGTCICNSCDTIYDVNGTEILWRGIGKFEVEWNLSTLETKVMTMINSSIHDLYTIAVLLPLDISEEKLQKFLTFS